MFLRNKTNVVETNSCTMTSYLEKAFSYPLSYVLVPVVLQRQFHLERTEAFCRISSSSSNTSQSSSSRSSCSDTCRNQSREHYAVMVRNNGTKQMLLPSRATLAPHRKAGNTSLVVNHCNAAAEAVVLRTVPEVLPPIITQCRHLSDTFCETQTRLDTKGFKTYPYLNAALSHFRSKPLFTLFNPSTTAAINIRTS